MRHLKIIFISILLSSVIFAEEDIYSYKFNLDTTITGQIIAEGNIFPNSDITFISYVVDNYKKNPPRIEFLDGKLNTIEIKKIQSSDIAIRKKPLVFDFDGDSYDEVVFTFSNSTKLWLVYFDPSSNLKEWTKIINRKL